MSNIRKLRKIINRQATKQLAIISAIIILQAAVAMFIAATIGGMAGGFAAGMYFTGMLLTFDDTLSGELTCSPKA